MAGNRKVASSIPRLLDECRGVPERDASSSLLLASWAVAPAWPPAPSVCVCECGHERVNVKAVLRSALSGHCLENRPLNAVHSPFTVVPTATSPGPSVREGPSFGCRSPWRSPSPRPLPGATAPLHSPPTRALQRLTRVSQMKARLDLCRRVYATAASYFPSYFPRSASSRAAPYN